MLAVILIIAVGTIRLTVGSNSNNVFSSAASSPPFLNRNLRNPQFFHSQTRIKLSSVETEEEGNCDASAICATLNLKDSERAGQRNDRNGKKTQSSCRCRALGSVRLVRELGCGFPSGESSQRSSLAAAAFPCSVHGSERRHRLRGISQVSA